MCPSAINGNTERGTGIINNELYIGRLVWNRLRYIRHPSIGKRQSRLNPPDDWIILGQMRECRLSLHSVVVAMCSGFGSVQGYRARLHRSLMTVRAEGANHR